MRARASLTSLALLAAIGLAGAAPALADTGSIVFTRDGDLWLAQVDGSGQHQVTLDGAAEPYLSASQADDGTIVSARGGAFDLDADIVRMTQNGTVLSGPTNPLAGLSPPGGVLRAIGPFAPRISPNGATIAFDWSLAERAFDPGSPLLGLRIINDFTGYVDAQSGADRGNTPPLGSAGSPRQYPAWIDDQRVVVVELGAFLTTQVFVASIGQDGQPWFDTLEPDPLFGSVASDQIAQTAITRTGDRLASYRNPYSGAPPRIEISSVSGFSARPAPVCAIPLPPDDDILVNPSWSPDGQSLIFRRPEGIWRADAGGCGPARLLLPGAGDADWGPAPVAPAPRPAPGPVAPTPPSGAGGPTPPAGAPPTPPAPPAVSGPPVSGSGARTPARAPVDRVKPALARPTIAVLAGRARVFRFRLSEPARVGAVLSRRVLTRGTRSFAVAKRIRARALRPGARALALGRLAPGRYRLRVTAVDAAGNRRVVTRPFTVPRPPRGR